MTISIALLCLSSILMHTSSDVCPHCGHVGRSPTGPYMVTKQQEPAGEHERYGFFERLMIFFHFWFG